MVREEAGFALGVGGLWGVVDGVVCRCVGLGLEGGFLAEGFETVGSGPWNSSEWRLAVGRARRRWCQ